MSLCPPQQILYSLVLLGGPAVCAALAAAIRPGDRVTIHGLEARELGLIRARSLTNDASAATVLDIGDSFGDPFGYDDDHGRDGGRGHHHGHRKGGAHGASGEVQGKIKMQLHDIDGDVDGVLLADGTIVHFPSQTATAKAAQLGFRTEPVCAGRLEHQQPGQAGQCPQPGSVGRRTGPSARASPAVSIGGLGDYRFMT